MEILDKKSNRMSLSNELFFTFYEFATAYFIFLFFYNIIEFLFT